MFKKQSISLNRGVSIFKLIKASKEGTRIITKSWYLGRGTLESCILCYSPMTENCVLVTEARMAMCDWLSLPSAVWPSGGMVVTNHVREDR